MITNLDITKIQNPATLTTLEAKLIKADVEFSDIHVRWVFNQQQTLIANNMSRFDDGINLFVLDTVESLIVKFNKDYFRNGLKYVIGLQMYTSNGKSRQFTKYWTLLINSPPVSKNY